MALPLLVIQAGGGKKSSAARTTIIRRKLKRILAASYKVLLIKSALHAVMHAVQLLEDDPMFNAGRGSQLQADGRARLSASLMNGRTGRFAAVINLEKIKNPIFVAHALLKEKSRVLAGEGAQRFARGLGLRLQDTRTKAAMRRWKTAKKGGADTVGAVALDRHGRLASATSTGGRGFERPGRVSDSGMPVANYASDQVAISATGIGEEIIEEGLAVKIATRVTDGMSLKGAFQKTFREVRRKGRRMGAIAVDSRGHMEATTTTEILLFAAQKGKRRYFFTD